MAPLLFLLFFFWIIVLGFKGVFYRLGQLGNWLCTPWRIDDDSVPMLRGTVGQSWSADEYRRYSSLAKQSPVPAIPDVLSEMQQALEDEKRTAKQLGDDITQWKHAIGELNRAAEAWTEKAANCLAAGRNELARTAIAERQKAQQRAKELEGEVQQMQRLLTNHASDIQNLETKLSSTYRRSHLAETRLNAAETSSRARQMLYGEQVKDALSRFEEIEHAADLAEGHADALALGQSQGSESSDLDAQLAALRDELPTLPAPAQGFGRKTSLPK